MRRPGPHEELTDPANELFLGTLTQRAWHLLNGKSVRARWYADYTGERIAKEADSISDVLFHQALQTSGSVGGAHRQDLTRAIIGAQPQALGLAVPTTASAPAEPAPAPQPKRGL